MSDATNPLRPLAPEDFREVIGHFASGVTVVTAVHDGEWFGTTASAVSSLSLEPPMLLVCMNKSSTTGQAIERCGKFGVNILTEEQPDVAERFARKGASFESIPIEEGRWGEPLLSESLATLECRVAEEVSGGTHTVFIAEVDHGAARGGAPLAYFRGTFGRLELPDDAARHPLTLEAVEAALSARLAIELGVVELSVGETGADRIADLREAVETGPSFWELLVGLGGRTLSKAYRRLGPATASGKWDDAYRRRLLAAYEAADYEAARRVVRERALAALASARRDFERA